MNISWPNLNYTVSNISNDNSSPVENYHPINEKHWEKLTLVIFVFVGIIGNCLVCLAVLLEKKLRNVTNYFLCSLAMADLLVCLIVMPCSIIVHFMGYWPYGVALCDIWLVSDVMMSTSSIMHMCIISLDRYVALRNPLKTRNKSCTRVVLKIALVWFMSLFVASPLIILSVLDNKNVLFKHECKIFNQHFLIYGSLSAYFIPLIIMFIAYALTIQLLHTRAKDISGKSGGPILRRITSSKVKTKKSQIRTVSRIFSNQETRPNGLFTGVGIQMKCKDFDCTDNCLQPSKTSDSNVLCKLDENDQIDSEYDSETNMEDNQKFRNSHSSKLNALVKKHQVNLKPSGLFINKKSENERKKELSTVQTEKKAVKVLGAMFGIFFVCWTPFFSINLTMGICKSCDIDAILFEIFLWLGYVSSTLNPIIYTIFNNSFKRTFAAILTCKMTLTRSSRQTWKFRSINVSN